MSSLSVTTEPDGDVQYAEFTEDARDLQAEIISQVRQMGVTVDRAALRAFPRPRWQLGIG